MQEERLDGVQPTDSHARVASMRCHSTQAEDSALMADPGGCAMNRATPARACEGVLSRHSLCSVLCALCPDGGATHLKFLRLRSVGFLYSSNCAALSQSAATPPECAIARLFARVTAPVTATSSTRIECHHTARNDQGSEAGAAQ